jgi:hypothetical protein
LSELGWWMQLGKQLKIVIIFVFVFFNVLTWYVILNPRNDSFWSYGISGCSFLSQGLAGLQAINVPGIENVSSNVEPCAFLSWYPEFIYINDLCLQ